MAAFGVPQAHEDDAERAVRAALEILDGVERARASRRGSASRPARSSTERRRLDVRDRRGGQHRRPPPAARGAGPDPARPRRAHGSRCGRIEVERRRPARACAAATSRSGRGPRRLRRRAGAPARVVVAPLVGREHELDLLQNTFARASRDRRAHLVTIYGEPGVGKSRLASEFVASLEGATVLHGRCLPYGEGITYWPLAEMVKARPASPTTTRSTRRSRSCASAARTRRSPTCSGSRPACSRPSTASAASRRSPGRRANGREQLAQTQPLVLVFEDIHWAEEPLLELIEHLAAWVRDGRC